MAAQPPAGTPWPRATGVDTIDVLSAPAPVVVAIGDSITEGYVSGDVGTFNGNADDYRNSWTMIAQTAMGVPISNAGVSGQGLDEGISHLGSEVFPLQGVTDCVVLLGTNDLPDYDAPLIEARLQTLFDTLKPFCRVWAGTLLPKERTSAGSLTLVNARRHAVNDWIRQSGPSVAGVVDFEAAVAAPGDVDAFKLGLTSDGIHPSIQGDAVLGRFAAAALASGRGVRVVPGTTSGTGGRGCSVAPSLSGLGVALAAGLAALARRRRPRRPDPSTATA